jgi:predicted transcriptional regulator
MLTDTGTHALQLMMDNDLTELPLVSDNNYIALISEDDILEWEDEDALFSEADYLNYRPAVAASSHPYEALKLAHRQNLNVIPVVDDSDKYIGCVTNDTLLSYIAENSGLDIPGAIIVIEIEPRNYSLYEIARIFENQEAIIINTQLFTNVQTNKLEITIKCNRTEVSGILSSLEHNKYKVIEVYGNSSNPEDIIDRYKLLMSYLNM